MSRASAPAEGIKRCVDCRCTTGEPQRRSSHEDVPSLQGDPDPQPYEGDDQDGKPWVDPTKAPLPVHVTFPVGLASVVPGIDYQYVDLWSRRSTWGGGPLPAEGDSVVIPNGTTVVLDVPRGRLPQLHTIILQGDLRFDDAPEDGEPPEMHLNVRPIFHGPPVAQEMLVTSFRVSSTL